jgi:exodeoxyribonuclease VIII
MHILIDIETLGKKPGCPVLSIGAVAFDYERPNLPRETFYWRVAWAEASEQYRLPICPDTLAWWLRQDRDALIEATGGETSLEIVLTRLAEFIRRADAATVWGNAPSFDLAILAALYERVGIPIPWQYWQERCHRTALDQYRRAGVDLDEAKHVAVVCARLHLAPDPFLKHHALHDAIYEVETLLACHRASQPSTKN